ncbi:MAG: dolichol kinase [Candidatus Thermoplasmatota archaeon]
MFDKGNHSLRKIKNTVDELTDKLNSLEVDVHWYRRIAHTFASSFLVYYLLPDEPYYIYRLSLPIIIFILVAVIEYLRLYRYIDEGLFFGLRRYEKGRIGGYLYFAFGFLLLILLFPQQIAIPCVLCVCFTDPVMGELRYRFNNIIYAGVIGFVVSFVFFFITWFHSIDIVITILISVIGGSLAVIGELWKNKWIDDDFLMQMLPAVGIFIIWQMLKLNGVDILPSPLLYPII